jgi:hypothetical protein
MCLDGTGLDPRWRQIVVVFNATESAAAETVPALAGAALRLHPAIVASADPVLRTASADPATGTLTVPARSVAVYVAEL